MEYYKKVDKSIFYYGTTIPDKYVDMFLFKKQLEPGKTKKVILKWRRKNYIASLNHVNRKDAKPVYQIRWDNNRELLLALKKEFIQSFLAIESKNYEAKTQGKYFRTDLMGGSQEVF